ncbi:MAG: Ku protein [Proteobacteria bacterium]|nr:Ku protein [Burkholderiales bacterium]
MPRVIWKGAIAFGLVHIPVALRGASREHNLDFDWLDRRDMAPVGYQRINKRTGKPIENEHVVKGYKFAPEQYVLMTDEDFRLANPDATQTVEIMGFIDADALPPEFLVAPYYLEVLKRGEKGYALLRDVLQSSKRVAIARVVMHGKQHLAALLVRDPWLMLITMRFADEVLAAEDMTVVGSKSMFVKSEADMARRLVDDMTVEWHPEAYKDTYRDDLLKRIDARIAAGETGTVAPVAEEGQAGQAPRSSAKVIDLMAALRASLERKTSAPAKPEARAGASATKTRVRATSSGKARKSKAT